ncbi:hypothetical protein BJ741DRAFT_648233 [Chytriomyces cf. hyalinus JEL632]|nr:hypothetical protein BJ741DRAFT_648233 [Chytriomyces cf. hyalinus JEL632]
MYDVRGKVAFITGVGAGFGAELAQRLAQKGALIGGCDINVEKALETADKINSLYPNACVAVHCDVGVMEDIEGAFKRVLDHFGRVDIVVNNAGISEFHKFIEDPEADWKTVIDIDLNAVIKGTQLGLNQMRKQSPPGGVIVNVASMAGFIPDVNMPIYVAAKMGVVGFTRSLGRKLLKTQGVRVNGIAPTFAMTNMGKLALQSEDFAKHVANSTVPVPLVIDAFMRAIEDDSLSGDILRITAQNGIDVLPTGRASQKKKDSSKL